MAKRKNGDFSQRLNQAMIERGLYPSELSRLSGVPRSVVYEYINGMREPSLFSLVRLAKGLRVSADYLCGLTADMQKSRPDEQL